MQRILLFVIACCLSISIYACGGITHMYIATELIPQLTDSNLRNLIQDNMDAYLVGSNYPDTGYVSGAGYGEDSHWEPFIMAYIAYLRENYTYPEQQNPKLVAFLLGIASHSISDIIFHGTLLNQITAMDFNGDRDKAHPESEYGIDIMITVEKNQWLNRPSTWWVPVNDLVAIYQKMGKSYTANQIIWGNSVYSLAGIGERAGALADYPVEELKMPWTAKNYYTAPQGGILMTENLTALYVQSVWKRILGNTNSRNTVATNKLPDKGIELRAF